MNQCKEKTGSTKILNDLGYSLDFEHPNEIVYKKQMVANSFVIIKIWQSENDIYILKRNSNNEEYCKFSLKEFEALHFLLIEKGWLE